MTLILPEGYVPEEIPRLTEATWWECGNPFPMLHQLLQGAWKDRKLRLFAVACCRRIWHLIDADYAREAIDFAEHLADGHVSDQEAHSRCLAMFDKVYGAEPKSSHAVCACYEASVTEVMGNNAWDAACFASRSACAAASGNDGPIPSWKQPDVEEARKQSDLLRCIFGNPFRPASIDRAWLTQSVVALAQGIYDDRAFKDLPTLADALEEAGCTDADLLAHCRGPGPHVRGCWVVDLVLGKE
jgi:hypothetical protein